METQKGGIRTNRFENDTPDPKWHKNHFHPNSIQPLRLNPSAWSKIIFRPILKHCSTLPKDGLMVFFREMNPPLVVSILLGFYIQSFIMWSLKCCLLQLKIWPDWLHSFMWAGPCMQVRKMVQYQIARTSHLQKFWKGLTLMPDGLSKKWSL